MNPFNRKETMDRMAIMENIESFKHNHQDRLDALDDAVEYSSKYAAAISDDLDDAIIAITQLQGVMGDFNAMFDALLSYHQIKVEDAAPRSRYVIREDV